MISEKLIQWAEHLATFDFVVQYIWGLDNSVTDVLLWLPMPSSEYALSEASHDITLKHITGEGVTLTELQTATNGDEVLQQVLGYIWSQWPTKQQVPNNLLPYYHT